MRQGIQTRKWTSPEGYKYLAPYANAVLLRFLVRTFTTTLPSTERRRKEQLDDSGRSVVSNIEEGWKRDGTMDYLKFLSFSQGSLEEVKGLCRQARQDGFLTSREDSTLANIGIDLKEFKGKLEESLNIPLEILYSPLKTLRGVDLTFEMFLELCNKTDWLLRRLVESLEQSITKEDTLSLRERWLGNQMENKRRKEEEFDRQLREEMRKKGNIYTVRGYVTEEEAKRLGLEEI